MKLRDIVSICVGLPLIVACATPQTDTGAAEIAADGLPAFDRSIAENNEMVASNLVFVLAQLDELRPIQTTIQIEEPASKLGKTVLDRLRDAGFGIQKVESDVGHNYVRYKFEESTTERGQVTRYTMSIGDIDASRDYAVANNTIYPDSALEITGVAERYVELNDDIFSGRGANYVDTVFFTNSVMPEVSDQPDSYIALAGNSVTTNQLIKRNVHSTLISNYQQLFDQYDTIDTTVLIFANDSMELGNQNKRIVSRYAENMNPGTDLISVIGCSHGKSTLKNGNSVLAVGRANRVKEEFVFAGVDYGKVLEEGCWADEHFDEVMPRRGVVLSLKRKKI